MNLWAGVDAPVAATWICPSDLAQPSHGAVAGQLHGVRIVEGRIRDRGRLDDGR